MSVLVHKAVEPKNLSKAGKQRFADLLGNPNAIVQPKYDGVYCQLVDEGGPSGAHYVAYSRTGERMPSVSQLILSFYNAHGTADRYIGELWAAGTSHADLNGAARRQYEQPQLAFVAFDADWGVPVQYTTRLRHLRDMWKPERMVISPKTWLLSNDTLDDLYAMAKEFKDDPAGAYDGLMLKDPLGMFIPGDGKGGEVIKIKPRNSGDFRVIGVVEGKGKAAGMAGALVLDLGGGVTCEVGTGLDDDTRKDYWRWWDMRGDSNMVALHGAKYTTVERIDEIEYLAITKDGKLREPSFKSTRWDKSVADVLPGNIKGED